MKNDLTPEAKRIIAGEIVIQGAQLFFAYLAAHQTDETPRTTATLVKVFGQLTNEIWEQIQKDLAKAREGT